MARLVLLLATLVLGAPSAHAVTDDLQCFKVRDQTLKKLGAVVDLDAPAMGVAAGCRLGRAELYCVPAETTVRPGTLANGKEPVTPLPFVGPPAEHARLCYRVKCKKGVGRGPEQVATDQFGTHRLAKPKTSLVCRPVVPAHGFCGDGMRAGPEACEGADLGGATCASLGYLTGTLGCTSACTHDVGGCVPIPPSFTIRSPDVQIDPGQEIVYCYYFRTPNAEELAIKTWTSTLAPPAARVVMRFTATDVEPPDVQSASNCHLLHGLEGGAWPYFTHEPADRYDFPADDGTGTPVAQVVPAAQRGYLWIHYRNLGDAAATGHVEVTGIAHEPGTAVTRADSYVTYDASIGIGPNASTSESVTCGVPAGATFASLSVLAHRRAVQTYVKDGTAVAFDSTDWLRPGRATWSTPPFLAFAGGELTAQCDYVNPTNGTIVDGPSTATDEVCIAIGSYFPSTTPRLCYDGILSP